MTHKHYFSAVTRRWAAAPLCLMTAWAQAQTPAGAAAPPTAHTAHTATATLNLDASIGAPTTPRADLKLPELRDLGLAVPRPVRAASAMLGLGRQRLALVVGITTVGARQVVDSAGRDARAVAAALREGGFVVMLREDVGGADLRAALKEFHDRLQPGGVGFAYLTGLGAQVEGENLLLPRDSNLDPALPLAERQAQWLKAGVPLSDVVDALMGPADSPRLLVVDAAYQNPALTGLPAAGLAAQKLPPGMMALYGHPLGKMQEVPAVGALASPPPTDARELAASPFARALVGQLLASRKSAPEVLRATRRSLYDGSLGQNDVWLAGDTDNEELAESTLLDLIPHTPEELAREAASQAARALTRQSATTAVASTTTTAASTAASTASAAGASAAGEQSVAEVLDRVPRAQTQIPEQTAAENMRPSSARNAVADTQPSPSTPSSAPALPDAPQPPSSLLSSAASVGSAVSTAVGVAGTVASVATTAATAALMVKAAEAAATVSVASTALSTAGSVAGQMVALAARSVSGSAGEPQAAGAAVAAARAAQTASAQSAATAAAAAVPAATAAATATAAAPGTQLAQAGQAARVAQTAQTGMAPNAGAPLANAPGTAGAADTATGAAARSPVTTPARTAAPAGDLPVEHFSPAVVAPTLANAATAAEAAANAANAANAAQAAQPSLEAPDKRTVRNPNGGERPAYAPRTNSYGYAEGDTYTYQVLDTWKNEVISRYTTAIEEVLPDGQMLANGQQMMMDAQGRLKKTANADGSISQFEPSQDLWWSNPKRGESRDLRFTETIRRGNGRASEVEWKGSTSVGKARKIDTPAGEYEALPIESSGWAYEARPDGLLSTKWSRTVWYSTKLGHPVAIDIEDADRLGRLLKRQRIELLHAQSARAATP